MEHLNDVVGATTEIIDFAAGTGSETLTSTSYTRFAGATQFLATTITTGTLVLLTWGAELSNNTAGATTHIAPEISGATTVAASDSRQAMYESSNANDIASVFGTRRLAVTAGSNTFRLNARVSAGTGTITRPRLIVERIN